jgi:hypothetical protein
LRDTLAHTNKTRELCDLRAIGAASLPSTFTKIDGLGEWPSKPRSAPYTHGYWSLTRSTWIWSARGYGLLLGAVGLRHFALETSHNARTCRQNADVDPTFRVTTHADRRSARSKHHGWNALDVAHRYRHRNGTTWHIFTFFMFSTTCGDTDSKHGRLVRPPRPPNFSPSRTTPHFRTTRL